MGQLIDYSKVAKTWASSYMTLALNEYEKHEDYRKDIFMMDSTDNIEDRDVEFDGIDEFAEWDENQEAAKTQTRESFETKYRQKHWGLEISIGRLERKFLQNKEQINADRSTKLGWKANKIQHVLPFRMIARGFDATYVNGYGDGKRLFSSAHPLSLNNSNTWSNLDTTAAGVTEQGLENLIVLLDETPETTGEIKNLGENGYIWLVTTMKDYIKALRIVDPNAINRPGTFSNATNNEVNAFNGKLRGYSNRTIEVKLVPWLRSTYHTEAGATLFTNPHFLIAKGECQLRILTSIPFGIEQYEDKKTASVLMRGSMSFGYGVKSPRGIAGSPGDGNAISG